MYATDTTGAVDNVNVENDNMPIEQCVKYSLLQIVSITSGVDIFRCRIAAQRPYRAHLLELYPRRQTPSLNHEGSIA
ncbi:uncharacterized protein N7496_005468 [Penicillium cataractarum]|uniref:Uncharacterized protein n=1 Tax=Penicillium cataractarum TaxID=2100454 RepID=A0A9W9SI04_9EURO|nr:uncharacterized protein N7496_005468 [Penicillium cataractarum]KAJ5378059.1 hypothetical protein N7496_005468 [Penicillium cataractarum]